jgi:hypothetical protein
LPRSRYRQRVKVSEPSVYSSQPIDRRLVWLDRSIDPAAGGIIEQGEHQQTGALCR